MLNCLNFFKKKKYNTIYNEKYGNFDLENIEGKFYVESVYDGDTITILVPIKLSVFNMVSTNTIDFNSNTNPNENIVLNKIKVRLYGIDTPELKPNKNLPNRDEHIAKAKEARNFLSGLILNKIIMVTFLFNDKYGRPLVKLYTKEITSDVICLNDLMIKKGYAKKYNGRTKDSDFGLEFVDVNI
jgi:endonuclease YncB( thermonuclease family)